MRVVLAANDGYLPGVVVTVHSLLRHLTPDWAADLTLLTDGFSVENEMTLHRVDGATGRDYPPQPNGS